MINLAIDVAEDRLRAKIIHEERHIPPDLTYDIEGENIQVWLDVSGIELEEIEDLVWATVVIGVGKR